jgi:hypothetical protein
MDFNIIDEKTDCTTVLDQLNQQQASWTPLSAWTGGPETLSVGIIPLVMRDEDQYSYHTMYHSMFDTVHGWLKEKQYNPSVTYAFYKILAHNSHTLPTGKDSVDQFCLVLEGELTVRVGEVVNTVASGCLFQYNPINEVKLEANDSTATFLIFDSPTVVEVKESV